MSALIALERVVSIDENDMILVNVGLSSIGLATIDLANNVFRSQVIFIRQHLTVPYFFSKIYNF